MIAGVCLAPAALAWLRSGEPARVLHVFDRAAYLINDQGHILLLAVPPVGMGPFTLLIEASQSPLPGWLSVADPVRVHRNVLDVGRVSIRLETAALAEAAPHWEGLRRVSAAWAARLRPLRQILQRHSRHGVFAGLLTDEPISRAGTVHDLLTLTAWKAADDLLQALPCDDKAALTRGACGLAGLGQGFTPSGDDFLMGTMFALWATIPDGSARRRSRWLADAAADRTTRASAAWLAAAARGEAAEPWHRLFAALEQDRADAIQTAAHRILRTGHTSGEDALIGFVGGVERLRKRVTRGPDCDR